MFLMSSSNMINAQRPGKRAGLERFSLTSPLVARLPSLVIFILDAATLRMLIIRCLLIDCSSCWSAARFSMLVHSAMRCISLGVGTQWRKKNANRTRPSPSRLCFDHTGSSTWLLSICKSSLVSCAGHLSMLPSRNPAKEFSRCRNQGGVLDPFSLAGYLQILYFVHSLISYLDVVDTDDHVHPRLTNFFNSV